ncbi:EcoKI restriction-modification system protein HsdS [compost metagenome]
MPLEEWMAAIIDYRGKTPEKTSSGIPLITAKIVKGGRIEDPQEFIAEDAYEQWMRRGIPEAGDVVLTTEAPLGEVAQLGGEKVALAQRVITLRGKPDLLDNTYLKFALQSQPIQEQLQGRASGSTVTGIKQSELRKLQLTFPPLEEQRRIARILGSVDDKIDLNRRINQTLGAMAQAIFKSWFVDFDPVRAKIAAKAEGHDPLRAAMSAISGKPGAELDALPSEQYDQLASTAALFPDGMEESELGEIPRGWTVPRVSNVLELVYGKALKSTDRLEGTVPVYGSGGVTGYHNAPLVPHGSIIVGRKGTVGSLYWEDEPFFPIDTTYYVRPLAAPLTFCYYAMQTLGLEKMNTDAAVPGLNRENVYRLELVLPDLDALQKFDVEVLALRKAMSANSNSNKALANLRNTLLPKLLSGELPVEKVLMEADK